MTRNKILTVRITKELNDALIAKSYDLRMTKPEYVNYVLSVASGLKDEKNKYYIVRRK